MRHVVRLARVVDLASEVGLFAFRQYIYVEHNDYAMCGEPLMASYLS